MSLSVTSNPSARSTSRPASPSAAASTPVPAAAPAAAAARPFADDFTASRPGAPAAPAADSLERLGTSLREGRRAARRAQAAAPRPVDLADPAPMARDAGGVATRRAEGELFVHGPGLEDPRQGVLGDCYFVAAMAAVAQVAPERIRSMMTENADGTFRVRLNELDKQGVAQVREFTVDPDLHVKTGAAGEQQPVYSTSAEAAAGGRAELWVPLLEKAYAQMQGGYENIGNGGDPAQALQALLGVKTQQQTIGTRLDLHDKAVAGAMAKIFKMDPKVVEDASVGGRLKDAGGEQAWAFLQEATAKKDPMVATSYHEPELMEKGILPIHAYTVVGVEEKDGQRLVTLRNPAPPRPELAHDEKFLAEMRSSEMFRPLVEYMERTGRSMADLKHGTFSIPWDDFRHCFSVVARAPLGG